MVIRSTLPVRCAGLSILLALAGAPPADADCGLPDVESVACASLVGFGPGTRANQIAADGHTIVGSAGGMPALWLDGVLELLGPLPDGTVDGHASAATSDGSLIVGQISGNYPTTPQVVFRWTPAAALDVLELPLSWTDPSDVSEDGHVISVNIDSFATVVTDGVPASLQSMDYPKWIGGLSADGSRSAGMSWLGMCYCAWLWQRSESGFVQINLMQPWIDVGDFFATGYAEGISPDGSIIVGRAQFPRPQGAPPRPTSAEQPIRWDDLAHTFLPVGAFTGGSVEDLSANGSLLVGAVNQGTPATDVAALWHGDDTLELLADRLGALGVDATGWSLGRLVGVSDDGRTVVGNATHASVVQGFTATLSPAVGIDIRPGSADNVLALEAHGRVMLALYGSSSLDVAALDTGALAFGPGGAPVVAAFPLEDLNGDGFADRRLLFQIPAVGLASGDTSACLEAPGADGFRVCSHVAVTPGSCGDGFALALIVPPVLLVARRRR